jgi:hypothetical protein
MTLIAEMVLAKPRQQIAKDSTPIMLCQSNAHQSLTHTNMNLQNGSLFAHYPEIIISKRQRVSL